ncbi:unnamed protein product, partial [Amoebophrya sp. A120]|eukprot:GSA120T00017306001.1
MQLLSNDSNYTENNCIPQLEVDNMTNFNDTPVCEPIYLEYDLQYAYFNMNFEDAVKKCLNDKSCGCFVQNPMENVFWFKTTEHCNNRETKNNVISAMNNNPDGGEVFAGSGTYSQTVLFTAEEIIDRSSLNP